MHPDRRRTLRTLARALLAAPLLTTSGLARAAGARPDLLIDAGEVRALLAEWEAFGAHRTGSAAEHNSALWLAALARRAGSATEVVAYPFDRVELAEGSVTVGDQTYDGLPMFDGAATPPEGVSGKLAVYGEDGDIALLEASPNGEYEPGFVSARKSTRYRALVVITRGGLPGIAPINAPYHPPGTLPIIQVSSETRLFLRRAAVFNTVVRVVTRLERKPAQAWNVVATIAGTQPALAPLVVATPRSGWGPCVGERGGGVLTWLALARQFRLQPPARTILLVASSGHELGHLGMDAFEAAHPGLVHDAHAWIHLGANLGATGAKLILQGSSDDWLKLAEASLRMSGAPSVEAVIAPGTKPYGEARNVFDGGGRYLSVLGTAGPGFHHPADRLPEAVKPDQIASIANAFAHLGAELALA